MRVALVGSSPSSRMLAPYSNPEWAIWACSPDNVGVLPRITAWFDPHGDYAWQDAPKWESNYLNWMCAQTCEMYVHRTDLITNATRFPAKELVEEFGAYWFTSSLAWMMAFALTKGAKEIGVYGADMATRAEYLYQRPAMHYWMQKAYTEYGVAVYVPPESDLLQPPPLYGYSDSTPHGRKLLIRDRELQNRIVSIEAQMEQLKYEKAHLTGARDHNDYDRCIWTGGPESVIDLTY